MQDSRCSCWQCGFLTCFYGQQNEERAVTHHVCIRWRLFTDCIVPTCICINTFLSPEGSCLLSFIHVEKKQLLENNLIWIIHHSKHEDLIYLSRYLSVFFYFIILLCPCWVYSHHRIQFIFLPDNHLTPTGSSKREYIKSLQKICHQCICIYNPCISSLFWHHKMYIFQMTHWILY